MGELSTLRANNEAMKAYFEFMTIPAKMDQGTLSLDKNVNECQNTIEFRNVSFHYPDSDIYVLKNINLTFTQGKRVAVVGENGSGKTTMIKLMCRLYEPTEGEILLNGTNIKEYAYDEYLKLFSIVFEISSCFLFPWSKMFPPVQNMIQIPHGNVLLNQALEKGSLKCLMELTPICIRILRRME